MCDHWVDVVRGGARQCGHQHNLSFSRWPIQDILDLYVEQMHFEVDKFDNFIFYFFLICFATKVSGEIKCGATSRWRKITLRNPAKQKTDCTYTIRPASSKVCQVKCRMSVNIECCRSLSIRFWYPCKGAHWFRHGAGTTHYVRWQQPSQVHRWQIDHWRYGTLRQ